MYPDNLNAKRRSKVSQKSHRNNLQKAKANNNKYFFKHNKHRKPVGVSEVGHSAREPFVADKVRTEKQ